MSEHTKRFEDYLPRGSANSTAPEGGIADEVAQADQEQEARQRDPATRQFVVSTPPVQEVDWEKRYRELEIHNSQQAQYLGQYKKLVDDHIASPTPQAEPAPVTEESQPITVDDLYDNPDKAIQRAVESHPAIREAREIAEKQKQIEMEAAVAGFTERHPDYRELAGTSEFQTWVNENPMRLELYSRGNQFDLSAADALFSLYKAESGIQQMTTQQQEAQAAEAVSLEESSAAQIQEPPRYSRSEYVQKLTRARQGDLDADEWVKRNAAGYRQALVSGNVRD
jgi:hypothetical protein